ncbi:MAG: serine hydrolase domain-containing protein [Pseudomonadota bacterium]
MQSQGWAQHTGIKAHGRAGASHSNRASLWLAGLLLACAVPALAAEARFADLTAELREILEQSVIPGAAIAVSSADRAKSGTWFFGMADIENETPVSAQTLFRYGSVSKNITSLIALRLIAQGTVSLEDPIASALPSWQLRNPWRTTAPVQLVHLLEHTSGLDGSSYAEYAYDVEDLEPAAYLDWLGPTTLRWRPGTLFSYANPGHTIAAAYLTTTTEHTFDSLAQTQVFDPLGMSTASFRSRSQDPSTLARSYSAQGTPISAWLMPIRPSGSLTGTLADGQKLLQMYLDRGVTATGARYLPPALLARMERSDSGAAAAAGLADSAYGLGNFAFRIDDELWRGHWGQTEGFRTHLGYQSDAGHGFVVLLNGTDEGAARAIRTALGRFLTGARAIESATTGRGSGSGSGSGSATAEADPIQSYEAYAGSYINASHEMALRHWLMRGLEQRQVALDEGQLQVTRSGLQGGGTSTFAPTGGGAFRPVTMRTATSALRTIDSKRYWIDGTSFMQVSWIEAAFWRYLPIATAVAIVLAPPLAWRRLRDATARVSGMTAPRITALALLGTALAGAVTFGLFAVYGLTGNSDRLERIGTFSPVSITLLVSAAAAVLLPITAAVSWVIACVQQGSQRQMLLLGELLCLGPFLAMAAVLAGAGWLPLRLWLP